MLSEETTLQKEELAIPKHLSVIFDATPRNGDFFAMLARCVVLNEELKRATCKQTLIHCAAVKGSLNGDTLAGEVTRGLAQRGKCNEDAVAGMMDGCYTNGAAQNLTNDSAALHNELQRLVLLCISHCANNAGEQANALTLEYFWKLIMKVFASSDAAKVNNRFSFALKTKCIGN